MAPNEDKRERPRRKIEARVRELHAIGQRCARLLRDGPSAIEHGDLLYDEHGLPKGADFTLTDIEPA